MSSKKKKATSPQDRIRAITEGGIVPQRPDYDSVPKELEPFVDDKKYMKSFELFWQTVNIERLRLYISETRESLYSESGNDDFKIHVAIRDHLDSVQVYLGEVVRQMRMNPSQKDSNELRLLSAATLNMAYIRGDLSPSMNEPFVLDLPGPKRSSTNYKGDGVREKPEMTLQVCVPFLHMINGIFTRKFKTEELDYLIQQLTGYAYDSVRQCRPHVKPLAAKRAIPALEEMLESLKRYANK